MVSDAWCTMRGVSGVVPARCKRTRSSCSQRQKHGPSPNHEPPIRPGRAGFLARSPRILARMPADVAGNQKTKRLLSPLGERTSDKSRGRAELNSMHLDLVRRCWRSPLRDSALGFSKMGQRRSACFQRSAVSKYQTRPHGVASET